jgi:hypothetical protein
MKYKIILAAFLAATSLAGNVHAGYISILGEDARVWKVNTSSGAATLAATFPDPGGSKQEQFSPNGLGASGNSYFYTNFNVPGADTLFRDGVSLVTVGTQDPFNIANGDAVGSNYYFVDRHSGNFYTISNILGAPGTQSINSVYLGAKDTMGDIAIRGTTAYLSYDGKLATFDITNPGNGLTKSVTQSRFVGLGFDGDSLYGVLRAGDNNFDLYSINTATLGVKLVADISGIPTNGGAITGTYEITDAASAVPVPAAAWLLASGMLGLAGIRRRTEK